MIRATVRLRGNTSQKQPDRFPPQVGIPEATRHSRRKCCRRSSEADVRQRSGNLNSEWQLDLDPSFGSGCFTPSRKAIEDHGRGAKQVALVGRKPALYRVGDA